MTNERALIAKIVAHPDDDDARRVLADFYEVHGQEDRAAFVRHMLELESIWHQPENPRSVELHRLCEPAPEWSGIETLLADWSLNLEVEYRRGLVHTVILPGQTLLAHGDTIRQRIPTLQRLVVTSVRGLAGELSACRALTGLDAVVLACWYSRDDAEHLARSIPLSSVRRLELWRGRDDDEDTLLRPFARQVASWPHLAEVTLTELDWTRDPRGVGPFGAQPGAPLVRSLTGFPDRMVLHPDFGYGVRPGRMRDGDAAVAVRTAEGTMLWRIDDRGEAATGFQLRLERPQDDEELLAQLSRRFGFEPDFVWVAPGSLPIDAEWNVDPDEIGHDQHPEFVAGDLCAGMYRHRRDLEFTVWDLWADWRGLVHSS